MTGRWKRVAGVLAAVGGLALGAAGTAQAWDLPSVVPHDGSVLAITSDGAVRNDPVVGPVPLALTLPAVTPNYGQQPKFDLPHAGNWSDQKWVFTAAGAGFQIHPAGRMDLCLHDGNYKTWE